MPNLYCTLSLHLDQQVIALRKSARVLLSVIVPCFNEEDVIEQTHATLVAELSQLNADFEIVYVDDGSRDRTPALLRQLLNQDRRVRVIRLSRNFGHQIAVTAGLDQAQGQVVTIIDADLQDPPSVISEMLDRWRAGFDVVYGRRLKRAGETPFKLLSAAWYYRLINWISEIAIPMDVGDFRLMDRAVVDALRQMPENDRFLRGMVSWVGFQQTAVLYNRQARVAGETKYPLRRMFRLAFDGILSFSNWPLRLSLWTGGALLAAAVVFATMVGLGAAVGLWTLASWSIVLAAMMLLSGLQLLAVGTVGEYVSRIYREAKGRPLYFTAERLGFPETAQRRDAA